MFVAFTSYGIKVKPIIIFNTRRNISRMSYLLGLWINKGEIFQFEEIILGPISTRAQSRVLLQLPLDEMTPVTGKQEIGNEI